MNWSTYDWDHPTPTNGWVASGVSLMLNFRGSDDVCFRGGGVPFVLRLPGAVKGENGPDDDEDECIGRTVGDSEPEGDSCIGRDIGPAASSSGGLERLAGSDRVDERQAGSIKSEPRSQVK